VIVFYDDADARRFEPFATSRPLSEMRAGALLVRERWQLVLGASSTGFVSAPHLDGFTEFDAPSVMTDELPVGSWVVNTRAIPVMHAAPTGDALCIGDRVAAVRLATALPASALRDGHVSLESLATFTVPVAIEGRWLGEVWDLIGSLVDQLNSDIPRLAQRWSLETLPAAAAPVVFGSHAVYVESGATIEPLSVFDVSAGPVLIRRGATVQAFTRVVGPCYIGVDSTVTTDRVAASSIGDVCRVHGELSTSILIGHANKGHDGFVGHSILGRWVNLGAGTITSNLKNTYGAVALWTPTGVRDTGQQFLGTLFGDHAKAGIGLRLTTGCVIGVGANVFDTMPPKAVAPFSWGSGAPYTTFTVEKFLDTASRMMARRHVDLGVDARAWWQQIHAAGVTDQRWPRS
jgi:UDP-N-acetylglucosamine diphosphorylase/glucosamine-1-phosphate N-acetyltransferase